MKFGAQDVQNRPANLEVKFSALLTLTIAIVNRVISEKLKVVAALKSKIVPNQNVKDPTRFSNANAPIPCVISKTFNAFNVSMVATVKMAMLEMLMAVSVCL